VGSKIEIIGRGDDWDMVHTSAARRRIQLTSAHRGDGHGEGKRLVATLPL